MGLFNNLFGNDHGLANLDSKAQAYVDKSLQRQLMRSFYYRPWFVYLRRYIIFPLIKFPFLPLLLIKGVLGQLKLFDSASQLLKDIGKNPGEYYYFKKNASLIDRIKGAARLLWKPYGHPVPVDKHFAFKLVCITATLWLVSVVCFGYSAPFVFLKYLHDVLPYYINHWLPDPRYLRKATAILILKSSCYLWFVSVVAAVIVSNLSWLKNIKTYKNFLIKCGYKEDEILNDCLVLASGSFVYLKTPSINKTKIKAISYAWPGNFIPGEIYESMSVGGELIMFQRPAIEPIIFRGDSKRKNIMDMYPEVEARILKVMEDARNSRPDASEKVFLGEVIDPRWWESHHIYTELGNAPHFLNVGQTRSGKSKGVLATCILFHLAYPDTIWYFADGKGSPDYEPLADWLSEFPVAKPDDNGDPLIQLANIVDAVYGHYVERKGKFAKATAIGKPCSTIYQYRKEIGPMPQIFLVIDEFSVFVREMDWLANFKTNGTISQRLKALSAEAASYGIHLFFATQRYQADDVPSALRANLTGRFVYCVQPKDADFLEAPGANELLPGQCYVSAPGLFSSHIPGVNQIKCQTPYIGDSYMPLLQKYVEPIDRSMKKQFNMRLEYNRGGMDNLSITDFCIKLNNFFKMQDYIVVEKTKDFESSLLQMEIWKGKKTQIKDDDGIVREKLTPIAQKAIGVSVIKPEDVHPETFHEIQTDYADYPAIIVFIAGAPKADMRNKTENIEKMMNDKKNRFFVYHLSRYKRDMKKLQTDEKDGIKNDFIFNYLSPMGLSSVSHKEAAANIGWMDMSAKTPYKIVLAKYLKDMNAQIISEEGFDIRGIPALKIGLIGGWVLNILIVMDKTQKGEAKAVAESIGLKPHSSECSLILFPDNMTEQEKKSLLKHRCLAKRASILDEVREKAQKTEQNGDIFKPDMSWIEEIEKGLGLYDRENRQRPFTLAPGAEVKLECKMNNARTHISAIRMICASSSRRLAELSDMELPLENYTLSNIMLDESHRIVITGGFAPLRAIPSNTTIKLERGHSIIHPADESEFMLSKFGILVPRPAAPANHPTVEDRLLKELKRDG